MFNQATSSSEQSLLYSPDEHIIFKKGIPSPRVTNTQGG